MSWWFLTACSCLFFPLGGIFSLGKYRAIYYYFEMRRNIIIILLSEGTKYYYFIEKEDKMLLEGEILLFETTKYCYFWNERDEILFEREKTKCYYIILFEKDEMLIFVKVKYWAKYYYFWEIVVWKSMWKIASFYKLSAQ